MIAAAVQCELMNTIRQRQLNFLGHVMRCHGLENTTWLPVHVPGSQSDSDLLTYFTGCKQNTPAPPALFKELRGAAGSHRSENLMVTQKHRRSQGGAEGAIAPPKMPKKCILNKKGCAKFLFFCPEVCS